MQWMRGEAAPKRSAQSAVALQGGSPSTQSSRSTAFTSPSKWTPPRLKGGSKWTGSSLPTLGDDELSWTEVGHADARFCGKLQQPAQRQEYLNKLMTNKAVVGVRRG